ncbi:hypothetical protein cyc_07767 [Cyclospora cayetanensis]|uniref:Uncharacterized protein n=1 Tax=Cyclospora cayetanensis TaxID=88456 RepID=A0A1D3D3P0_9EIME|nr:hypothetical protein cyc_07767 [Cyclospora cayetanensis]
MEKSAAAVSPIALLCGAPLPAAAAFVSSFYSSCPLRLVGATSLVVRSSAEPAGAKGGKGFVVVQVDPHEFGIAGLTHPRVMHLQVADLDLETKRFRWVARGAAHTQGCRTQRERLMEVDATSLDGEAAAAEPENTGGVAEGELAAKIVAALPEEAAAPNPIADRAQGDSGANRPHHQRVPKDKCPDSFAKLADQWLRMQGTHPVTFEEAIGDLRGKGVQEAGEASAGSLNGTYRRQSPFDCLEEDSGIEPSSLVSR